MHLKSASLFTLSIAGLLAGAPVMAIDSYIGCLTPGGTITHLALNGPKGGACPPKHTQIALQYGEPVGGISGYEIAELTNPIPAGGNLTTIAYCSAGKVATGGGVFVAPSGAPARMAASFPAADGDGWATTVYNDFTNAITVTWYAVCADVAP